MANKSYPDIINFRRRESSKIRGFEELCYETCKFYNPQTIPSIYTIRLGEVITFPKVEELLYTSHKYPVWNPTRSKYESMTEYVITVLRNNSPNWLCGLCIVNRVVKWDLSIALGHTSGIIDLLVSLAEKTIKITSVKDDGTFEYEIIS